ncbi:hypothetical protein IV417_04945 [Alphaproteobacteria bacterium KMM 3653]|uniref:DUF35 domain-containing protein n=1 Tax=Harenicola maris TaxID=2841044 RepID=A0AAP2CQJ8_9RHOB|nr:hypothetical protein [Harenicola maris]
MKRQVTLDYTLPEGALRPYFEGLREGRAMASHCVICGRVAFPARAQCCGADVEWRALSGRAQVERRTDGGGRGFALVRFEGADTRATVGITNPEASADAGELTMNTEGGAGIWLTLDRDQKGGRNV